MANTEERKLLTDPKDTPENLIEIGDEYILNYCAQQGAEALEWLKETRDKLKGEKKGTALFMAQRRAFAEKYFPEILKRRKGSKKATFDDKLEALLKKAK